MHALQVPPRGHERMQRRCIPHGPTSPPAWQRADGSSDATTAPATAREGTTEPAEQYINDIFSRIVSVRRYRDNDSAAGRCEDRMGRGGAGCQAFFGIRHYCKLLKQLNSRNSLDYCEPYIRDLPRERRAVRNSAPKP